MNNLPNLNVYKSANGKYKCRILSMKISGLGYQATNFQFLEEFQAPNITEARKQFSKLLQKN